MHAPKLIKKTITGVSLGACLLVSHAWAHEPVFSFGPEAIWFKGLAVDSQLRHFQFRKTHDTQFNYEVAYGITEDFSILTRMPVVVSSKLKNPDGSFRKAYGLNDLQHRFRYRFYKYYEYGRRLQGMVNFGFKFPTSGQLLRPAPTLLPPTTPGGRPIVSPADYLGTSSIDFNIGVTGGLQALKEYFLGLVEYWARTSSKGFKQGNALHYSLILGMRPHVPTFDEVDYVFFLEADGIWYGKDRAFGQELPDSGGHVLYGGPTMFITLRNVMVRAGIQIVIGQHLNGQQDYRTPLFRAGISYELHF